MKRPVVLRRLRFYLLDGVDPIPVDQLTWGKWFQHTDHHVAWDRITDKVTISTIFTGLDMQLICGEPPLLFETMIFGGKHDHKRYRHSAWDEAIDYHTTLVAMLQREQLNGGAHG